MLYAYMYMFRYVCTCTGSSLKKVRTTEPQPHSGKPSVVASYPSLVPRLLGTRLRHTQAHRGGKKYSLIHVTTVLRYGKTYKEYLYGILRMMLGD